MLCGSGPSEALADQNESGDQGRNGSPGACHGKTVEIGAGDSALVAEHGPLVVLLASRSLNGLRGEIACRSRCLEVVGETDQLPEVDRVLSKMPCILS